MKKIAKLVGSLVVLALLGSCFATDSEAGILKFILRKGKGAVQTVAPGHRGGCSNGVCR